MIVWILLHHTIENQNFNVKKTARSGHINYMADNITTDSGIIIK